MSGLTLNRLRPGPCEEVDATSAYAYPDEPGHFLRVNMVSSVDGAATLDGRVGTLTGPADQRLLLLLRALSDVLIVGAGTIRAEGYGPLTVGEDLAPLRAQSGLSAAPRLVVPTRSLDLDLDGAAFSEALEPPLVVTTRQAPVERVRAAESVAEVLVLGDDAVDLVSMVDLLAERGAHRMLCEGGPGLLAGLIAQDLVDELCLAVAPVVTCGTESRITAGPALTAPRHLSLAHVAERDDFLFLRYTRPDLAAADDRT
jgi:riboflavin biosynthesis pyrimidine reductase